jgi:hypothetical protein
MPDFTFEEDTHTYRVGSNSWMSVTQSLPNIYYGNNTAAMEKGRFIHDMCRMYLLNDLDESSLDSSLIPYLDALKKFLNDSNGMGIRGVFDIKSGSPNPCVELQVSAYVELVNNGEPMHQACDPMQSDMVLEEPFYHPIHQHAGTPDIIISGSKKIKEGHALYLKDNGNYSLSTIKNIRQNFETFLCFLKTAKWKREHNLCQ